LSTIISFHTWNYVSANSQAIRPTQHRPIFQSRCVDAIGDDRAEAGGGP